jgi:uncharacterized repeat protein (TIGR01451 family)
LAIREATSGSDARLAWLPGATIEFSLKLMKILAGLIIASVFRAARPVGLFDVGVAQSALSSYRSSYRIIYNSMKSIGILFALMTTFVTSVHASEAVELRTQLIAEVREPIAASGRQFHRMVPAKLLSQGEVVYYTVRITNPTPVFANNVVVSQMIPANTTYVDGSAVGPGADVEFSIDGGVTFARAADLKLDDTGTRAPPERYTHIRWRLQNPLAPGAVALARFRATFR